MAFQEKRVSNYDVTENENFGWKKVSEVRVRHGRHHHFESVMQRDCDMPNYASLVKLEERYYSLKSQLKCFQPIDPAICILGFLFFILPGLIYVIVKSNQKNEIDENNINIERRMKNTVAEAKKLLA